MRRPVAVVAGSLAFSLIHFRGALISRLVAMGYRVLACAPDHDQEVLQELHAIGAEFRRVPMGRTGLNPFYDLRTLVSYLRLFLTERPDLVLAYTHKPIIYAGLALRLVPRARFSAMITGLGYVFAESGRHRWLQFLTTRLFRAALRRAKHILVFNPDDGDELLRRGMLSTRDALRIVPGSGVDLQKFHLQPVPQEPQVFLLVARLITDKGIREFANAAAIVRGSFPSARFQLLGPFDSGPAAISAREIDDWVRSGHIEYLGSTRDVRPYLAECTVCVLPSYREGLSRTVLEAMATGRAVITTDAPGCRDAVEHGRNGLLVRPRSAEDLASAMMQFCRDPTLAEEMGSISHRLTIERYEVGKVNDLILDFIVPCHRSLDPQLQRGVQSANSGPDIPNSSGNAP